MEMIAHWVNDLFIWIGFGTLAGLIAKAILPGKDPGGTVATLCMGIGGTVIGSALFTMAWGSRIAPLSVVGFVAAICGSTLLLVSHRVLSGRLFKEQGTGVGVGTRKLNGRKRSVTVVTKE